MVARETETRQTSALEDCAHRRINPRCVSHYHYIALRYYTRYRAVSGR
jgi:hypothetical protein